MRSLRPVLPPGRISFHRIAGVGVSSLALLVCTSCGSSSPKAQSVAKASSAVAGHELIEVAPDVADTVDPDAFASDGDALDGVLVNSTLVVYPIDHSLQNPPGPQTLTGGLASSFTTAPTGITFTLRHAEDPQGDVMSSADVAWSFKRMFTLPNSLGHFLLGLAGVDASDPTTVLGPEKIRVNATVNGLTLAYLEEFSEGILDKTEALKHATAADPWATAWLKTNSDSFGPYQVSAFNPTTELTLTANPNFYGTKPYYTKVVIQAVTDPASRLELVESGQANLDTSPSLDEIRSAKSSSKVETIVEPSLADDALTMNNSVGPFKSALVRRAMSLAINRQALLSGVYFGNAELPTGVVSNDIPQAAHAPAALTSDATEAKALLKQAGYPKGFTFTLDWNEEALASGAGSTLISYLQSDLAKIGVTMNLVEIPSLTTYDAALDTGQKASNYEAWLASNRAIIADGAYELNLQFTNKAFNNPEQYSNPTFNSLVAKALADPIGSARYALVAKANAILAADVPQVVLMTDDDMYIATKGITGFSANDHATVYVQYLKG
jgi:peptide/nickel transport system substrate-binding protein